MAPDVHLDENYYRDSVFHPICLTERITSSERNATTFRSAFRTENLRDSCGCERKYGISHNSGRYLNWVARSATETSSATANTLIYQSITRNVADLRINLLSCPVADNLEFGSMVYFHANIPEHVESKSRPCYGSIHPRIPAIRAFGNNLTGARAVSKSCRLSKQRHLDIWIT